MGDFYVIVTGAVEHGGCLHLSLCTMLFERCGVATQDLKPKGGWGWPFRTKNRHSRPLRRIAHTPSLAIKEIPCEASRRRALELEAGGEGELGSA